MKHAYLIMAHNEEYILEKLIKLLDYKDNDLFIHLDKKAECFNLDKIKSWCKKSNIYFVKRHDVRWGRDTQIRCELLLLEKAIKNNYDYYHLLSGVDLPLKKQEEIHEFFKDNNGKEFIHFCSHKPVKGPKLDRINYYHIFNKNLRCSSIVKNKISKKLYYNFLRIEKKLKISRIRKDEVFFHGANWFSITDELAHYVVNNRKYIMKRYKYSFCADELFLQSLIYGTKFYDNLYLKKDDDYKQAMRYIDWNRGEPYTFKNEDFDLLINSGMLFARKFSSSLDKKIIDRIYEKVSK